HRNVMLPLDNWTNRSHRSTQSRDFATHEILRAGVGIECGIKAVFRVLQQHFAGYDDIQRAWPTDSAEGQILEQVLGSRGQRNQRRYVVGIRNFHALKRTVYRQRS